MKAVITGFDAPLAGRLATELVATGVDVVVIAEPERAADDLPARARLVRARLGSDEAVDAVGAELGADVTLVHLSGPTPADQAQPLGFDRNRFERELVGMLRVLDAARRSRGGVRAVIHGSSAEVYGRPADPERVVETLEPRPITEHAALTLAGEDHLRAFADEEGVRAVALRLAPIFGVEGGGSSLIARLLEVARRGKRPELLGDATSLHDLLHVDDAARGIVQAFADRASGAYNLSDGVRRSLGDIARALSPSPEATAESIRVPSGIAGFHLEIERARAELGFSPSTTFEQWLSRTGGQRPA